MSVAKPENPKKSPLNRSRVCHKAFTRKSGRKVKNSAGRITEKNMTTQWLVSKIIQSLGKNKWQSVFLVRRDKQIKKLFSSRKKSRTIPLASSVEEINYNSFLFEQVGVVHQLCQDSIWQIAKNH